MSSNPYRNILNNIAFGVLAQPVQLPDYRLAIGNGEKLDSIPILIFTDYYLPQGKPMVIPVSDMSFEQVSSNLTGAKLKQEDFPTKDFYLGSAIVGV